MGEEDGQVNLQIGVLSGSLQKDISFNFYILHLTAFGKLEIVFLILFSKFSKTILSASRDYLLPENMHFTLNSSQSTQISVSIVNDDIFEISESFLVGLSSDGIQSSAKVIILDNDCKPFYFVYIQT